MVKAAVTAAALAWLSFSCTALVAPSLRRSNAVRAGFAGKAASRSKRSGTISMYWHVFPRDYSDSNFLDDGRTYEGTILTKEYHIEPGESRNLGREDLGTYAYQSPNVDEVQCILQVAEDGSAVYAYAQGRTPTGWRTRPDEPWGWMQPGESTTLQSGWKVSLDCNNPESAVYKSMCDNIGHNASVAGDVQHHVGKAMVQGATGLICVAQALKHKNNKTKQNKYQ